jgi:hypothetical protein
MAALEYYQDRALAFISDHLHHLVGAAVSKRSLVARGVEEDRALAWLNVI